MKKFTDVEIHKENRRQALKAKQLQISSQSKKEEMALRFSHLK